jgi:hypothetical protein
MATVTSLDPTRRPGASGAESRLGRIIDRWIWVFTALLLIATVLAGFVPDSLHKVALVKAGHRAPFPAILHLHAVLMGAWLALLLAQTTLMATGRRQWHRQLGMAAVVLAPAIVITGVILALTIYRAAWVGAHAAHPELAATAIPAQMRFLGDIALEQIRALVLFPLLVFLGMRARRRDPGLHKRLMMLATIAPIGAAIIRIGWLPSAMPGNPIGMDLFPTLLLAPLFLWDVYRLRIVHRAYWIWLALMLPLLLVSQLLWGTAWWQATAPRMMGVI